MFEVSNVVKLTEVTLTNEHSTKNINPDEEWADGGNTS